MRTTGSNKNIGGSHAARAPELLPRNNQYGKKMLQLAIKFAFEITDVQAVHLNAFTYKDESWGRCNMIIKKELVNSSLRGLIE